MAGPRASARSEAKNVLEFRLVRTHFANLSVCARACKVRASADQGPKLGQRNIGQRPHILPAGRLVSLLFLLFGIRQPLWLCRLPRRQSFAASGDREQ
eukprot:s7052_g3.t1